MEADIEDNGRDQKRARREKRWSMNSQRLEEIVAELMKPISDLRRSFDTDLSALLEEYLTEAGLRALEAGEGAGEGEGEDCAPPAVPNFAELALLLQQSACIYGRKVDFLYQHVLSISEDLNNSTMALSEAAETGEEAGRAVTPRGRRRRSSAGAGAGAAAWEHVALQPHAGARRPPAAARPPPTLPRMYTELEPRKLTDADTPLRDYDGDTIGLPADYHVTWRLDAAEGLLVEELARGSGAAGSALRPVSLVELQAALEARAPPLDPEDGFTSPGPLSSPGPFSSPGPLSPPGPLGCSTPMLPAPEPPADPKLPLLIKKDRKRKTVVDVDDLNGSRVQLMINDELRLFLCRSREFSVCGSWVRRVVARRRRDILRARRARAASPPALHGFDHCDIGGFHGWTEEEAQAGRALVRRESDDTGFFEESSLAEDQSSGDQSSGDQTSGDGESPWLSWAAGAAQRAGSAAPVDMRALCAAALGALPPAPRATPFAAVLRARARGAGDVARLLLATLCLASEGRVIIDPPPPLSLAGFTVHALPAPPSPPR